MNHDTPGHTVEYIGPPGQTSPVFGPLTPGALYQCTDEKLRRVLIDDNATHWRLPKKTTTTKEAG